MFRSFSRESDQFLAAVQPLLEARDIGALSTFLKEHYTVGQLCCLVDGANPDAAKVAALSLGLVGDKCCIPCLADCLRDPDPVINQMAEHALWNVWFRSSSAEANQELARGAKCLDDRSFSCAFKHFDRALAIHPGFAEVYNQRAIAHYLKDEFQQAVVDYQKAVELMPLHFSAWAGLGHSYANLEMIAPAIDAYEHARDVNPHMEGISQAIGDLRRLAQRRASR